MLWAHLLTGPLGFLEAEHGYASMLPYSSKDRDAFKRRNKPKKNSKQGHCEPLKPRRNIQQQEWGWGAQRSMKTNAVLENYWCLRKETVV